MANHSSAYVFTLILVLCSLSADVFSVDFRGDISVEHRSFLNKGAQGQHRQHSAISFGAEFWHSVSASNDLLTFSPYFRLDPEDSDRHLYDIRELAWIHVGKGYELRTGIRQVYWGVTESASLVNIINQTDSADSPDTRKTLGQPMVNLAIDWGNQMLDLFLLAGSRTRTFPGEDGRLRLPITIDSDASRWESSQEQRRIDLAARWQLNQYPFVIGISAFSGTAREPDLIIHGEASNIRLVPFYPLINQVGIDFQAIQGDLLWKLEAIQRWGGRENFHAVIAGFEFTHVGILNSRVDLGWLAEGLYHNRENTLAMPFERDILLGFRLSFNDLYGSEILASTIIDTKNHERIHSIEGRRRLTNHWSISSMIRLIEGTPKPQSIDAFLSNTDTTYNLRPLSLDSYVQIEISRFF